MAIVIYLCNLFLSGLGALHEVLNEFLLFRQWDREFILFDKALYFAVVRLRNPENIVVLRLERFLQVNQSE